MWWSGLPQMNWSSDDESCVVFDFPNITDPNSEEADETIEILQDELKWFSENNALDWYIDDADATGEQE